MDSPYDPDSLNQRNCEPPLLFAYLVATVKHEHDRNGSLSIGHKAKEFGMEEAEPSEVNERYRHHFSHYPYAYRREFDNGDVVDLFYRERDPLRPGGMQPDKAKAIVRLIVGNETYEYTNGWEILPPWRRD